MRPVARFRKYPCESAYICVSWRNSHIVPHNIRRYHYTQHSVPRQYTAEYIRPSFFHNRFRFGCAHLTNAACELHDTAFASFRQLFFNHSTFCYIFRQKSRQSVYCRSDFRDEGVRIALPSVPRTDAARQGLHCLRCIRSSTKYSGRSRRRRRARSARSCGSC